MAESVDSLLTNAKNYTNTLTDQASAALDEALHAVGQVGYTQLSYVAPTLPTAPVIPTLTSAPTLPVISFDLPADPGAAPVFQDISPIEVGVAPTLNATPPTVSLPTKPAALADFQIAPPTLNTSLVFPDPPAALINPILDAPVLPTRVEPTRPQTIIPAFTAIAPTDIPVAPTDHVAQFKTAYAGAAPSMVAMVDGFVDNMLAKYNPNYKPAMAAIETQLQKYLNGGTALNASVETAIYDRARNKNNAESIRVRDTIYKDTADRGFTMPTGALLSAVTEARQSGADNNSKSANEIAIAQAEMEQKNLQFAVTTSTGLRVALTSAAMSYMQNIGTINGQALDYAKNILSAVIEVYNTAVKAYEVRLEAFKAEAVVFETKLKSAMAGIELYRVEVAALEALTNVDRARVEVYRARIESLTALSNVYRAQIEAVQGRASLEKLKIELFGAQVQAFGAQVQAKSSEYYGYSAAINGETAKVEMFNAQVRGYVGQVEGYRSIIGAKAEAIRAQATTNEARGNNYRAAVTGYSAVVTARGEVARTQLENSRQSILAFQAEATAKVSFAEAYNNYYRTVSEVAIKNAGLSIEAIVNSAKLARDYAGSLANLHSANATIYGNLAGSALAGMNTLASRQLTE